MDPRLVGKDNDRFWAKSFLELALERDKVKVPLRDIPGYFFSISIRRYPGLDQLISTWKREDETRVLAYVTAHLNVLGDVYRNNSDTGFWITQQDNGQTYVQNYGQFEVRAFYSTE